MLTAVYYVTLVFYFPFVASSDFRIFETKRSWSDARQTCHENDSSLADLHNFWTIRAALTTASSLGYGDAKKVEFWIGLVHNATTRQYRWSSGSVANRLFLAVRLCDKTPEETFKDDWCYALQRQRNTNSFKLQHKDCKLDMHTNQHFFICHYSDQSLDYQIHELEKTWTEAHLFCKENGSSLALLRTERDIASIHQKISSLGSNSDKIFWIGLVYNSTSSPGFHWSTGETALYEHLNEVYNLEPRDWCHLITKTKLGFACFERVACKQGGGEVDFNSSFICQPKDFVNVADSTRSMTVSSSSRDQPTEVGHSIVRTSQTVRLVSSSSFSHTRSFASSLSQATTSTPASGSNVQIQATSNAQYLKNVSSSILISEMDTRATSGYQRDFPFSSVQELRSSNANIAASRTLQSLTSLLLRTSPSGSDIMSANGMLELTSSQYSHSASLFFMSELSSHFIYQGGFSSFSSQIFASRNVNIKHQRPDDSLLSGPVSPHPENEELNDFRTLMTSLNPQDSSSLQHAVDAFEGLMNSLSSRIRNSDRYNVIEVARTIEEFALRFASFNLNSTHNHKRIENTTIVIQVSLAPQGRSKDFTFVEEEGEREIARITLPWQLFEEQDTLVVNALYNNLHEFVESSSLRERRLNSRILGSAVTPNNKAPFQQNVTLVFHTLEDAENKAPRNCVFWNFSIPAKGSWSGAGCTLQEFNRSHVVCTCNHLTNFAILMDVKHYKSSDKHRQALQLVTYIGLGISLLGETITVATYLLLLCSRYDQQSHVHVNLVATLAMAQLVFLTGIGATHNEVLCVSVAASIHYFYLVSFSWMLVEGFMLYLLIIEVYDIELRMSLCYLFSYGFPGIVVGGTLVVAHFVSDGIRQYAATDWCWLSTERYFIWSFVGPVLLIVAINVVLFSWVVKEMVSMPSTGKSQINAIRTTLKACFVLFPLLGVTWLFGLLSVTQAGVVSQYIFTVFNSLQGFLIFLLHCVRNSEIKTMWSKKMKKMKKRANYFFKSGGPPPTSFTQNHSCKQGCCEECCRRHNRVTPVEF